MSLSLLAQKMLIYEERFDPPRRGFLGNDVIIRTEALRLKRVHTAKNSKIGFCLLGSKR